MANFSLDGVNELIRELEKMDVDLDDVEMEMVNEAAEIMDRELKSSIASSTTKYGTGTLAGSIKHNPPRKNGWGYFTVSTATGTDNKRGHKTSHDAYNKKTGKYVGRRTSNSSNSVRNHDKLYWLEYGNGHQAPHPVVAPAVRSAESAVLAKMQEIYDRRVGN